MAEERKPNGASGDTDGAGGPTSDAEHSSASERAAESEEKGEAKAPASGKSPWPSAHKSERSASASASAAPASASEGGAKPPASAEPAPWGAPLARFDRAWTTLEARLCAGVVAAEVLTLAFWIGVRAMSSTGRAGPGMIFRALVAALVFGIVAHRATKKHARHEAITTVATLTGLGIGTQLGDVGSAYFSNLYAWLQNASILVFFGGVSELARRLTLWVALLGASLATAQGKHINVDVVMRFLSPRARVPVAVLGWVAAAGVAITSSWGFFDYVCVEELRAPATIPCPNDASHRCNPPASMKVDALTTAARRDVFLAGRQLSLDLQSFPKVLLGAPYNRWMTPHAWNEWLRSGGWQSHFKAEDVKAFELPEDGSIDFRNPAVTAIPGGTESIQKLLVPLLNLVFAFGLFVIGIRFILRSLLAISGWVKVDPAAAHGDDELAHAHDHSPEAELAEGAIKETHT